MSEEVDVGVAISQMEEHILSLGMSDAIIAQMDRNGRRDGGLKMALRSATNSLAECMVKSVIDQAEKQGLPATPILRVMSGIYQGPGDVDDASEIDVIKTFDFGAMERDKRSCYEQYEADVDTRAAPVDQ
jgi:hypothetical protein